MTELGTIMIQVSRGMPSRGQMTRVPEPIRTACLGVRGKSGGQDRSCANHSPSACGKQHEWTRCGIWYIEALNAVHSPTFGEEAESSMSLIHAERHYLDFAGDASDAESHCHHKDQQMEQPSIPGTYSTCQQG